MSTRLPRLRSRFDWHCAQSERRASAVSEGQRACAHSRAVHALRISCKTRCAHECGACDTHVLTHRRHRHARAAMRGLISVTCRSLRHQPVQGGAVQGGAHGPATAAATGGTNEFSGGGSLSHTTAAARNLAKKYGACAVVRARAQNKKGHVCVRVCACARARAQGTAEHSRAQRGTIQAAQKSTRGWAVPGQRPTNTTSPHKVLN